MRLLNIIEEQAAGWRAAQEEIQRLRDEINRLKGEQGKPKFKPKKKPKTELSSERERRKPVERKRRRKRDTIAIDREKIVKVDRDSLPADAEFKGYTEVVVQDVEVKTDNILFRKEKFYSASEGKTYLAELPAGYRGGYGPGVRTWALVLYFGSQMTEPKIAAWFEQAGIQISSGEVSNLLIKGQTRFHEEEAAVYEAGLGSSPWQHLDDTGTPVDGKGHYCHIMTNPFYTHFMTTASKNRLSVLDVLRNGAPRRFRLNAEALGYMEGAGVSGKVRQKLGALPQDQDLDEATLQALLDTHVSGLGKQSRKWVLDAMAVAAYHAQTDFPVVQLLVCDDAGQYTWVTEELALCWVHEGRHYKRLTPVVPLHRQELEAFQEAFWKYYDDLLAYRQQPTPQERARLDARFDALFSRTTGYAALDDRIAKTRVKKDSLLKVLTHPEIPLHNNPAELGARQRVRKRVISFGPRVTDGVKAWDTFMSLVATTRQLGVNFYDYIYDRITEAGHIPPLASIIAERAQELDLGASWSAP
ncbi:MAG: transposase [Herbaspirillum sp.]|uniref:IS66 family transposase n=1 Tax=Herbaspirillum sp. TaxID=1890675 RepID=UPI00258E73C9|nr:transposase [Herbaspirillum sp.]MCP4557310.1 transposase [Herbaspirillum sp.]